MAIGLDGRLLHAAIYPENPFEEALFSRPLEPPPESSGMETSFGELDRRRLVPQAPLQRGVTARKEQGHVHRRGMNIKTHERCTLSHDRPPSHAALALQRQTAKSGGNAAQVAL